MGKNHLQYLGVNPAPKEMRQIWIWQ